MKTSRRMRRYHLRRMKTRSEKLYKTRKFANHLAMCSCWMCGNPRKYLGEKTRQELQHEEMDES